jgi:hypothetical protein
MICALWSSIGHGPSWSSYNPPSLLFPSQQILLNIPSSHTFFTHRKFFPLRFWVVAASAYAFCFSTNVWRGKRKGRISVFCKLKGKGEGEAQMRKITSLHWPLKYEVIMHELSPYRILYGKRITNDKEVKVNPKKHEISFPVVLDNTQKE